MMDDISLKKVGLVTAVGVSVALVGVPTAISILGFKSTGIAAGTLATKMMSSAAVANGGQIIAGSGISLLQSAGVLGVATKTAAMIGGVTSGACAAIIGVKKSK